MKNSPVPQHQDWHDRWQSGRIGFHQSDFHPSLLSHWPNLKLEDGGNIFVPLCGKSLDMVWLAKQGHDVIGVELSDIAAQDFFVENNIDYKISTAGKFKQYQGGDITILVGDFFDLTKADITNVKAVYDRAALIALSPDLRQKYVQHLKCLLSTSSQILLITLNYGQAQMDGPPFSVPSDEVRASFNTWCDVTTLDTSPPEDFRGIEAFEATYRLSVK